MSTSLLDANVLIALAVAEHTHHDAAHQWFRGIESAAVCPSTQGSLARFLLRTGESGRVARRILTAFSADPRITFWPDTLPYDAVDLDSLIGHRQVTDAYLAALARHHAGTVATFDTGLAAAAPDVVELLRP